jgi:hypothetical protein
VPGTCWTSELHGVRKSVVTHVAPNPHGGYAEPLAHLTDGQVTRVIRDLDMMFESGDCTHVRVLSSLEDWTHNSSLITRLTKNGPDLVIG